MDQSKRIEIQELALENTVGLNRCGLGVSMGVGKTLIGLKHMDNLYNTKGAVKFLVVAPKLSIFKTWQEDIVKFNLEHLLPCIKFTTYRSLEKQDYDYDCVYLDECHNLLYNHDTMYLGFYHGKILGLSGTPPRNKQGEKGEMVQKFCPIVYSYITDDAIDDNILNDYRIIVHLLPLSTSKTHRVSTKNGGGFMTSELEHYNYWSKKIDFAFGNQKQMFRIMRMQGIMQYATKERYVKKILQELNDKCIIFCNTTEQADKVCENSYHSKNAASEFNLERFKSGDIMCLSSVQQLNEGVNIPNLKYGIILHAYSNERKTNQRIGRLLRLNPDQESVIHILAYRDTVDAEWVSSALHDLDQSKITWKNAEYNS